jgi:hypothetical protein
MHSQACRASVTPVTNHGPVRAWVRVGLLVVCAATVVWLMGARAPGPTQRTPAVELRPVAGPALSVMSIDLLMAPSVDAAPVTLGPDSPLGSLQPPAALTGEQLNLARFIAQRYRVALADTERYVRYAFLVADEYALDPVLLLAVMSVESSFNPKARSSKGAKGLMQVLARVHTEKFEPYGGVERAYDPLVNIRVGARILRDYIARDGSIRAALKSYVGAALLSHDYGYGRKVMREHARLSQAALRIEGAPGTLRAGATVPASGAAAGAGAPTLAGDAPASADVTPPLIEPSAQGLSVHHGRDAAAADLPAARGGGAG